MLARAAAPGMVARGEGAIINLAGVLAFGAPAPVDKVPPSLRRAVYTATLAHIVALSQAPHERSSNLRVCASTRYAKAGCNRVP